MLLMLAIEQVETVENIKRISKQLELDAVNDGNMAGKVLSESVPHVTDRMQRPEIVAKRRAMAPYLHVSMYNHDVGFIIV